MLARDTSVEKLVNHGYLRTQEGLVESCEHSQLKWPEFLFICGSFFEGGVLMFCSGHPRPARPQLPHLPRPRPFWPTKIPMLICPARRRPLLSALTPLLLRRLAKYKQSVCSGVDPLRPKQVRLLARLDDPEDYREGIVEGR